MADKNDEALLRVIHGMIDSYIKSGSSWKAMTFDLMQQEGMEQAFMVIMNAESYKTISLMLDVLRRGEEVRSRVYHVILAELDEIKKEQGNDPPAPE